VATTNNKKTALSGSLKERYFCADKDKKKPLPSGSGFDWFLI